MYVCMYVCMYRCIYVYTVGPPTTAPKKAWPGGGARTARFPAPPPPCACLEPLPQKQQILKSQHPGDFTPQSLCREYFENLCHGLRQLCQQGATQPMQQLSRRRPVARLSAGPAAGSGSTTCRRRPWTPPLRRAAGSRRGFRRRPRPRRCPALHRPCPSTLGRVRKGATVVLRPQEPRGAPPMSPRPRCASALPCASAALLLRLAHHVRGLPGRSGTSALAARPRARAPGCSPRAL